MEILRKALYKSYSQKPFCQMAVNDVQSRLFKLFSNHDDWVKSWANILKRILHKKKKRKNV